MLRHTLALVAASVLAAVVGIASVNGALLGIDYGTEWFKVALVQPGRPLDLVLNRDSKRKSPSVVLVDGLERTFGSEAVGMSGRKPENTFLNIKQLVGKAFDDPAAQAYRERYANRMVKGETLSRSIQFEIGGDEETTLTVQEIIAMQLQHAQKLVQEAEGVAARDAIIAIPSFYNPDQRQAVINAADIAGLHLIALINDGSAVALNYGMSREFSEEPEYHIFYDMGAGNTVVTAASFTQRKVNKKHQPIEVNILATSHDSTLGGSDIDVRLREFMLRAFEGAHKADTTRPIRENKRAMAKLLKEAARVKAILSVNAETVASVESLHEDIDFRAKVTREDLEDAIKDLGQRARAPLEAVIRAANLTIGEIGSVVLVGGSSRVPFIQNVIAGIVTKDKLARHLDADEACVVGTAFYGASMSRQFRVKDIQLNDVSSNAYQATFTPEEPGRESTSEIPLHSPIKLKRTIQDTRASDLKLAVDYYSGEEEQWVNFMEIAVTGAASSVNEVADRQHLVSETPLVKVQLAVNEYGMLGVVRAMAIYNSTNPAYEKYLEELSAWNEAMQTAEGEATSSESELKSATTQPEKPKKQPKYIAERVTLDVKTMYTGANALNEDDIKQAHALFRAMDTHDEASKERATNIYNLESLTYEVQEIIYDEVFIKVTTQGERDELESKARQASEWIEKDGDSASVQDIQARYDELMVVLDGLNYRKTQFERREEVAEALDMHLVTTRKLVDSYRVDYTGEELEPVKGALGDLEEALSEAEAWFEKKKAEQTALALTDDPVLTTEDMEARDKQVQRLLARVLTKKVKKIQVTTTDPAAEGGNSERSSQDSRQEKGDAEDNANGGADSETRGESEGRDGNAAEYAHDEL